MTEDHDRIYPYPRPLNNREVEIFNKANARRTRNKFNEIPGSPIGYTIQYALQDNFTIATLMHVLESSTYLRIGVCKRNPNSDQVDLDRAADIALFHACMVFDPIIVK